MYTVQILSIRKHFLNNSKKVNFKNLKLIVFLLFEIDFFFFWFYL